MQREQGGEGVGSDEGTIAAEDERIGVRRVGLEVALGHHHGVACAQLLLLERELDLADEIRLLREVVAHQLGAVADHQHRLGHTCGERRVDHPVHHGAAEDRVHDLGQVGLHARALAGGKDDGDESAVGGVRLVRHLGTGGAPRRWSAENAWRSELARLDSNQD